MPVPSAPPVNSHVQLQWWSRNPERDVDVQTAWRRGVSIEAPNYRYDEARLHEPSGLVILKREGTLKTVIYADGIELEDEHLAVCPDCGQRYNKTPDEPECHWCRGPTPEVAKAMVKPPIS